ncbi:MAG: metal ABC transporter substrate-binding protein [Thermodesulfobacteriota bacterium]
MKKFSKTLFMACLILASLMGLAGAGPPGKIPIAASIIPLGDFCRQIGGDRVAVQVLIPPGASPHVYEPTPAAMARAQTARLLVYVGAGLDPFAERFLQSRGARGLAVVEAVHGIKLLAEVDSPEPEHQAEHGRRAEGGHKPGESKDTSAGEEHRHDQGNPHVWLDPVLAQGICRQIAQALITLDPEHRSVYEANLQRYLTELEALNQEIARKVAGFRLKEYVCFHPAFAYLARRYGLKEVGVIELAPGREPTPRQIQKIVRAIRKYGVKVVFAEPQLSQRVAAVIAREAGAKVLILDPLGGSPPYSADYLKLMRYNLSVLEQAMQ